MHEGARYYTYSLPSLSEALPGIKLPDFLALSTANYKGYHATWAVIEKQLFLIGVEGRAEQDEGKRMLSSRELFPKLIFSHKVTRYSGEIKLIHAWPDCLQDDSALPDLDKCGPLVQKDGHYWTWGYEKKLEKFFYTAD